MKTTSLCARRGLALLLAMLMILSSALLIACGGNETPGGETPGGETPGGETPGGETPGDETPGGETPGGETPGGETPGGETPGGDTPVVPIDPEKPDQPIDPEDPEDPDQPIDPEDPENPDQPIDPEDPEDPDQPIDPEDPDEPKDPDDTDNSDEGSSVLPMDPFSEPAPDNAYHTETRAAFHVCIEEGMFFVYLNAEGKPVRQTSMLQMQGGVPYTTQRWLYDETGRLGAMWVENERYGLHSVVYDIYVFTHDAQGRPNGAVGYDAGGLPLGKRLLFGDYAEDGSVTVTYLTEGEVTYQQIWDKNYRPIKVCNIEYDYTDGPCTDICLHTYDEWGNTLLCILENANVGMGVTYDENGLATALMAGEQQMMTFTWDAAGRMESLASGMQSYRFSYDDNGLLSYCDFGSTRYSYTYDEGGRALSQVVGVKNESGGYNTSRSARCSYDAGGRLLSYAYESANDSYTETFAWDARGRLTRYEDGNHMISHGGAPVPIQYTYSFDDAARKRTVTRNDIDSTVIYHYDQQGNLVTVESDMLGQTGETRLCYDAQGRLLEQTAAGSGYAAIIEEYVYNDKGQLTERIGYSYSLTADGQLSTNHKNGEVMRLFYQEDGLMTGGVYLHETEESDGSYEPEKPGQGDSTENVKPDQDGSSENETSNQGPGSSVNDLPIVGI